MDKLLCTDRIIFYIYPQDLLDQLMHFLPQLSDFVPLRNGFYIFREQTA